MDALKLVLDNLKEKGLIKILDKLTQGRLEKAIVEVNQELKSITDYQDELERRALRDQRHT